MKWSQLLRLKHQFFLYGGPFNPLMAVWVFFKPFSQGVQKVLTGFF
jgi:hypothetical protein